MRHGGCPRARGAGPVVAQLGNGRAVSDASRRVRQCLRSTHTRARASTRTHAPTVHTPTHILMALHKHDHCTFLHLHADMCMSPAGRAVELLNVNGKTLFLCFNPSICLILLSETEPHYSKFYTNTEPRDGLRRCIGTIPTHPERERFRSRR